MKDRLGSHRPSGGEGLAIHLCQPQLLRARTPRDRGQMACWSKVCSVRLTAASLPSLGSKAGATDCLHDIFCHENSEANSLALRECMVFFSLAFLDTAILLTYLFEQMQGKAWELT